MMECIAAMDDSVGTRQMVGFTLTQAGYRVPGTMEAMEVPAEKEGGQAPGMDGIALVRCGGSWRALDFIPVSMLMETPAARAVKSGPGEVTGWIAGSYKAGQLVAVAGKAQL